MGFVAFSVALALQREQMPRKRFPAAQLVCKNHAVFSNVGLLYNLVIFFSN